MGTVKLGLGRIGDCRNEINTKAGWQFYDEGMGVSQSRYFSSLGVAELCHVITAVQFATLSIR